MNGECLVVHFFGLKLVTGSLGFHYFLDLMILFRVTDKIFVSFNNTAPQKGRFRCI